MRVICLISLAVKLTSCLSVCPFFGILVSLACSLAQTSRVAVEISCFVVKHKDIILLLCLLLFLSRSLASVLCCSLTHSVSRFISLSLSLGVRRGKLQILICEKEDAEKSQERRVAMAMGMDFLFVCMWEEIERESKIPWLANLNRDSSNIHLRFEMCFPDFSYNFWVTLRLNVWVDFEGVYIQNSVKFLGFFHLGCSDISVTISYFFNYCYYYWLQIISGLFFF